MCVCVIHCIIIAPRISTAMVENVNGNLSVTWVFLHTGGITLKSLIIQCSNDSSSNIDSAASTNALSAVIDCTANMDQCGTPGSSVVVGPVIAGGNYSCLVFAENSNGEDELRTNYIITNTGKRERGRERGSINILPL